MTGASFPALRRARPPVIIIGAHRSGTTATAQALKLLGLQLGERLDSHEEPREMQRLHENYLGELGAAWHDPTPFLTSIQTAAGKRACVNYLEQHLKNLAVFGYRNSLTAWRLKRRLRSGVIWGWKEPRTTLFANCWLELFPEARILHVVRNPLAVAASIQKRELEFQAKGDAPSGRVQDFDYGVELAMQYVETGEATADQAQHYRRVKFEDLQADPVGELRGLATFCDIHFTDQEMQRAAATIRPAKPDSPQWASEQQSLLTKYPVAQKLGYTADAA
ncbi:MAG TPA: sulfotransferase [Chthoniobacterales bacterium]|nr:sulfotransferase [Chthoniobacterales bacterium]